MWMEYGERFAVWFEIKGRRIVGEEEARLLEAIQLFGSIMKASKCLGTSYAHAWTMINKIQEATGRAIVRTRKGGARKGGAELTKHGKSLLERYLKLEEKVEKALGVRRGRTMREPKLADLVIIGSDCPALRLLLELMKRSRKVSYEYEIVGSGGGFAAVMMGEADLAGVHLLDECGRYNEPFIKRYWLEGKARLIRGYKRAQGLMFRRGLEIEGIEDMLDLKFVNRNLGSGTRVLFDLLLKRFSEERGMKFEELTSRIRGYDSEARTHEDVAGAVKSGRADVGFGIMYVAHKYGLDFLPLSEEWFDILVRVDRVGKPSVSAFIETLRSRKFSKVLEGLKGMKVCEETGKLL